MMTTHPLLNTRGEFCDDRYDVWTKGFDGLAGAVGVPVGSLGSEAYSF
jgi:hypothetical protein